jgi:hypothetical protein
MKIGGIVRKCADFLIFKFILSVAFYNRNIVEITNYKGGRNENFSIKTRN